MNVKKVIGVIGLSLIIGGTGVAFASDNVSETEYGFKSRIKSAFHHKYEYSEEELEDLKLKYEQHLKSLLDDGKITQEEYETRLENPKMHGKHLGKHNLSEEELSERKARREEHLKTLLDDGEITQEEYDELLEKPFMHRIHELDEDELEDLKLKKEERLKEALNSGKITQDQYDEILENGLGRLHHSRGRGCR